MRDKLISVIKLRAYTLFAYSMMATLVLLSSYSSSKAQSPDWDNFQQAVFDLQQIGYNSLFLPISSSWDPVKNGYTDSLYYFIMVDSNIMDTSLLDQFDFYPISTNIWLAAAIAIDTGLHIEEFWVHDTDFVSPYDSSSWGLDSHLVVDSTYPNIPKELSIIYINRYISTPNTQWAE